MSTLHWILGTVGASSALYYLFKRSGFGGNTIVRLCPHEHKTFSIQKGWFYDSYEYQPMHAYIKAYGLSIRPIQATEEENLCMTYGTGRCFSFMQ